MICKYVQGIKVIEYENSSQKKNNLYFMLYLKFYEGE